MDLHSYLFDELKKEDVVFRPPEPVEIHHVSDYLHNELHKEKEEEEDRSLIKPDSVKEYFTQNIGTSKEDSMITSFPVRFQQEVSGFTSSVNFDNVLGMLTADSLRNAINPKSKYVVNYLVLDTNNTPIMIDSYRAQWSINTGDPLLQAGVINVNFPIKNIVAMRLGTMYVKCSGTTYTLLQTFMTTALIEEFAAQSCLTQSGSRYHFIGTLRTDLKTVEVVKGLSTVIPISFYYYNNGKYEFDTPITNVDKITLRIYNQFIPLAIPTRVMAVLELVSERVEPEILSVCLI